MKKNITFNQGFWALFFHGKMFFYCGGGVLNNLLLTRDVCGLVIEMIPPGIDNFGKSAASS